MPPKGSRRGKDVVLAECTPLDIGAPVVGNLAAKGFCVVDAGFSSDILSKALQESMDMGYQGKLRRVPELVVDGLLGATGSAELCELDLEAGAGGEGLQALDQVMGDVAVAAQEFIPVLGFESSQRTDCTLHVSKQLEGALPEGLTETEASYWLFQFLRGAIMCLVSIGPDSGTLTLAPYNIEETEAHVVDLAPGSMVLLRSDMLSAVHESKGSTFILSCFLLDHRSTEDKHNFAQALTPPAERLSDWALRRLDELKTQEGDDRLDVPRQWVIAMNHQCFKGQHMAARGISCRQPVTWDPDLWHTAFPSGPDYMIEVPLMRWDHSTWYDAHPEMWRGYKTFTKHCSFIDGADLFDNKMFGIAPAESKVMDPQQRVILEAGYEALYSAGFKKGKIMNSLGGMYLGYGTATSDFGFIDKSTDAGSEGSFGATGGSAAITANRFSFCLGMKGPSIAIDAEDGSGLVSVHLGCEACEKKGRYHANEYSLVGGIRINMSAHWWPQKQAAGEMSAAGRVMTFNASADGFALGDGCCNMTMKRISEVLDNQIVVKDGPLFGVLAGSSINYNGRNAHMSSPHGPSEQEVISMSCRAAGLQGFNIDAAECYGSGLFLADAVEVSSWTRVLRVAEGDSEPLAIGAVKTCGGNHQHATGTISLMKAMFANEWGIMTPMQNLRQMNPHIDADQPLLFNTECLEYKLRSAYSAAMARGFGGVNACAIAWGQVEDSRMAPLPRAPDRERLVFWPGGGGELPSSAQPRKGFHIAGSFTQWEPEPMEMESSGVYGYDMTLGENRWEQFQIWLDGDARKCLHPEEPKAPKLTKVLGPDSSGVHTWHIEGRTESVPSAALLPSGEALADADAEALVEVGTIDRALIGAQYRIRLRIAGKYRIVDWERLTGRPDEATDVAALTDAAQALPSSSYFISADWNGWGLEPMVEDPAAPGLHALDVHLWRRGGAFQIVRNRDWDQVLYPSQDLARRPEDVQGPDDECLGRAWNLDGRPGNTFRIEFRRSNQAGADARQLSWSKTGDRDLTAEERAEVGRTRYGVIGSWDGGARLRGLRWTGSYYHFYVELGSDAKESFQLSEELDWDRLLHPPVVDASSSDGQVLGPSRWESGAGGLCWTIGTEGFEKAGDIFEVRAHYARRYFSGSITKVDWSKVSSGKNIDEAEAEGLVLRRPLSRR